MDEKVIAGHWNELRGQVKTEWAKLTDDDIQQIDGNMELLIGAIQERYGYTRDMAKRSVDDWLINIRN